MENNPIFRHRREFGVRKKVWVEKSVAGNKKKKKLENGDYETSCTRGSLWTQGNMLNNMNCSGNRGHHLQHTGIHGHCAHKARTCESPQRNMGEAEDEKNSN